MARTPDSTICRRCPKCAAAKITWIRKRQMWKCESCLRECISPRVGARYEKGKSGVIAGRIEHGRGSKWGAGIV